MKINPPYLMFLGDAIDQLAAKTANGVAYWRPDWCLGQFRMEGCNADIGLPDMGLEEAAEKGVKTLVIGVANQGGYISEAWAETLLKAVYLGFDIASGLHASLASVPGLALAAKEKGCQLFDVRHPTEIFDVGRGHKRSGNRLLTVGTDTSVGKMFTTLAIEKEMRARGANCSFRATGQTGIFIAGDGVSVDAVVADFISGSTEWLCPENDAGHWDLVEGQGSIHHASYAGVTLGLLHGSQPDVLVMCHDPGRPHMRGTPSIPVHSLTNTIEVCERLARLTNPDVRTVGVSINTSKLSDEDRERELKDAADETGLPAVDPVKDGVGPIVDRIMK